MTNELIHQNSYYICFYTTVTYNIRGRTNKTLRMKYLFGEINNDPQFENIPRINRIEDIKSNAELRALINKIRKAYSKISFQHGYEADAYYQTAIYMFIRIEKPYWKKPDSKLLFFKTGKQFDYIEFFGKKMSVDISDGFEKAADQLFSQWDRGHMNGYKNPEFPMQALELIAKDYAREFYPDDIEFIVKHLKPLAERANDFFRKIKENTTA